MTVNERILAAVKKRTHDFRAWHASLYAAAYEPGSRIVRASDLDRVPHVYPKNGDRWGNWEFKASTLVLEYKPADKHWWYEVDLERCSTSAGMLDWIFQVTNKARHCLSTQDLGDLLEALNDLLLPQENLCSCAQNKRIESVSKLIRGQMQASRSAIALSDNRCLEGVQ